MSEPTSIVRAIDISKSFFSRNEDEPIVPTDRLLLRELVHTVDILSGHSDYELEYGHDPSAPLAVLTGLRGGNLVARVFDPVLPSGSCMIIPRNSWPRLETNSESTAIDNGFWTGRIYFDHHCHGFKGQLPFCARIEAIDWLQSLFSGGNSAHEDGIGDRQTVKHSTKSELEAAFKEYVDTFDAKSKPKTPERLRWFKENGISRERGRALVRDFAPKHWRKPGRGKKQED